MNFIDPLSIILTPEELQIEEDIANGLYRTLPEDEKQIMMKKLQQASKNRQAKN